jgi:arylsulfatase
LLPLVEGLATSVHPPDLVYGVELWGHRGVQRGEWKIVWDTREGDDARWMLFNLDDDFGERHDLANERPEELGRMTDAWSTYAERNGVIYFNGR